MRYQRFAFALLTCGFPALFFPPSGSAQEPDARVFQEEAVEAERTETTEGEADRSRRSRRRGLLALGGNEATVEWILPTHQSIIDLAETAQENAASREVRRFAETLHSEHTEFVGELRAALEEEANRRSQNREERRKRRLENRQERSDSRSDHNRADADADDTPVVLERLGERAEKVIERAEEALGDVVDDAATRASRRLRVAVRGFPWIKIRKETAENALTTAREDLQTRQAREFDRAYVGYASAQHVHAIAELNAVESEASDDVERLIENHLAQMQRHRQRASELMEQLAPNVR